MTDFNTIYSRQGTYAAKWDGAEFVFGQPNLHPMWVADMDFPAPEAVVEALRNRVNHKIFGYTITPDSLVEAVCAWELKRYQWKIDKEWILFSPGVVASISVAIQALTEAGDKILMHSPIYPPFFGITEANSREVIYSALLDEEEQYQMNWDEFESQLQSGVKIFLLCHPHNPSGRVWTREELERMIDLCKKYDVTILSDEIHCDLTMPGFQHIPIASVDPSYQNKIVTFISPTKTFNLAGLHASSMIIPDENLRKTIESFQSRQGFHGLNLFGMVAMEAAYVHGAEWLDELLIYLQENIRTVQDFLADRLPNIKMKQHQATYLLWLDCRGFGVDQETLFSAILNEGKLALENGVKYGPQGEGYVRMNIACPRPLLMEGLDRLDRALSRFSS
ncbi:MAG TPA: PatB family C-S lyase [Bacillus sp. (in: firmicutes)]|uniref:MalY/PatB family protein n=1 Tax=Bacillus litorisediminis TaxID=2922713 RepID=UPI001FAFB7E8|nr:PatB family C-S lyase [Bacillus litorisediminis]HWO77206.1 PatB family C-S lyase [Bacillus sp. (in: firmicutes)]